MEIKKASDIKVSENLKILLYGSSGSAKTTQIRHLPGKVFMISAEAGELPLAGADNIDIVRINTFAELREAYTYINKHKDEYDWVALDSLSELGEQIVAYLKTVPEYSDMRDSFKLWMAYTELMVKICKSFRDLEGVGCLLLALDESVKNGLDEKIMPLVPAKKAQKKLVSLYDEVLFLRAIEEGKREFVCTPTPDIESKDRSGKLPDTVPCTKEKGIGAIIDLIKGGK